MTLHSNLYLSCFYCAHFLNKISWIKIMSLESPHENPTYTHTHIYMHTYLVCVCEVCEKCPTRTVVASTEMSIWSFSHSWNLVKHCGSNQRLKHWPQSHDSQNVLITSRKYVKPQKQKHYTNNMCIPSAVNTSTTSDTGPSHNQCVCGWTLFFYYFQWKHFGGVYCCVFWLLICLVKECSRLKET